MLIFRQLSILQKFLVVIAPLVSLFTWWQGIDPVNLPKMVLLGVLTLLVIPLIIFTVKNYFAKGFYFPSTILFLFSLSLFIPFFFSGAPKEQQFYGAYLRHTGLLTSLSLAVILFSFLTYNSISVFKLIIGGLLFSGCVNMLISAPQVFGVEILPYNNIFQNILGTFGNPNFIAAFLGLSCAVPFSFLISQPQRKISTGFYIFYVILALYLIIESNARQGLIVYFTVAVGAIGIKFLQTPGIPLIKLSSLSFFLALFVISGLGALGHGPLSSFLYKTSVGLRGQYWNAGIQMFAQNPLTGIGLNSYGDWYRDVRDKKVLDLAGVGTVTDSSHNVFIDYAATGGIFLLLFYIILNVYIFTLIIGCLRRLGKFNPVFSALALAWFGYHLQSLVSIDQIGLSIWGWVLGGSIISFSKSLSQSSSPEKWLTSEVLSKPKVMKKSKVKFRKFLPLLIFPALAPAIIVPLQRDVIWSRTLEKATPQGIIDSSSSFPRDESRLVQAISILANNELYAESLSLALETVEFKPRSFLAWKFIYNNPTASIAQKSAAKMKLLALDPLSSALDESIK